MGQAFGQDLERSYYLGFIGDDRVQMELRLTTTTLEGWYYSNRDGQRIDLIGGSEPLLHEFSFQEVVADENEPATVFIGWNMDSRDRLSTTIGGQRGTVTETGAWRGTVYRFDRIAQYRSVTLQQGSIRSRLEVPVFSGPLLGVNDVLSRPAIDEAVAFFEAQITRGPSHLGWPSRSVEVDLYYVEEDLVSALSTTFGRPDYTLTTDEGGDDMWVSGSVTRHEGLNLRIVNGTPVPLTLSDLFLRTRDVIRRISRYILSELADRGVRAVIDRTITRIGAEDLRAFALSPSGMTFAIVADDIGACCEESYIVTVPLEHLADLVDPDGVLGRFLPVR
ncbi:MAG: hypothetical protein ACYTFT_17155 [Planctomycetota bacterium]